MSGVITPHPHATWRSTQVQLTFSCYPEKDLHNLEGFSHAMIQTDVTKFTLQVTHNTTESKCLTTERTNKMFWSVYWSLCGGGEQGEGNMKQGIGLTDWQNVTVSGGPIRWSTGRWKQDRNKPTTKMSGADRLRDGGRGNRSLEGIASLLCFLGREKKGGAWNRPCFSFRSWFTVFNLPASTWRGQIYHISDLLLSHSCLIATESLLRLGHGAEGSEVRSQPRARGFLFSIKFTAIPASYLMSNAVL